MAFKLKNYTSSVPVTRTVAKIEEALASAGATDILKNYDDGRLFALSFRVPAAGTRSGSILIRMPVNPEAAYEVLREPLKRLRKGSVEKLRNQAVRTAWKIMEDWVLVQLSLIKMQKRDVLEVFLSYVWDGEQTFFSKLKSNHYLALTEHVESHATNCSSS